MKTFGELAKEVLADRYPHERYVYDHALPLSWVKEMQALDFSPAGNFVWLYMEKIYTTLDGANVSLADVYGKPEPITPEGALALARWEVSQ